jgi:excisionase family DNA binding protein
MDTNGQPQEVNPLLQIATQQSEILKRLNAIEAQQSDLILVRKDVLSFAEGIKYLDLSDSHVYKLTARRKIPHYKQGKLIYFVREELDKWLTEHKVKTKIELEADAVKQLRKMRV